MLDAGSASSSRAVAPPPPAPPPPPPPPPVATAAAPAKHLSDDEVRATAKSVHAEGERSFWSDDVDKRLDKFAEVSKGLDTASRARLVGQLVKDDGGAMHSWLQGSRLNEQVASGRIAPEERTAVVEGVAGAYNRAGLSYTEAQNFLGVSTDRAPALAKDSFQGARELLAGKSTELNGFREKYLTDSFALSAQRDASGMGMRNMDSAFAVTLAGDAGQHQTVARVFDRLDPQAQRAVANEIGQSAIGYRNSRGEITNLADPLALLTQSVRNEAPASGEAGRQTLTHIAEGLARSREAELQTGATAIYREVAEGRAQQMAASPALRAQGLARVADAQNGAAQVLAGLPANATPQQVWDVVNRNHAAVVAPTFTQYLELRGDGTRSLQGAALRNDIGMTMGLQPNRAPQTPAEQAQFDSGQFDYFGGDSARAVTAVEAKINEVGGANARVTTLPVTVAGKEFGLVQVPLFRVEGADGRERYVDYNPANGEVRTYSDFADWRGNNKLPPGQMTYAANGHLTAGADGKPQLVTANTPGTPDTFWENWGQPALDGVAMVGGVVLLGAAVVGTGGTALLVGGALLGAYGAARGGDVLVDRGTHGQTLNPLDSAEARNAWLNVGAGVVGFAAAGSSLRLASAAGRTGTGLDDAANLMRLANGARSLNVAAQYTGTAAMVDTGYSLAANWDRLSPQQRVSALAQMAFWAGGTAVAARQSGGVGNLYGAGDMSKAMNATNQWLKNQIPSGTQIKQVLSQAAENFKPAPGQRVIEVVTPDGLRLKMVVENEGGSTLPTVGGTGNSAKAPRVGANELAAWRGKLGVPADMQTIGVGRTDIPKLSGQTFEGASPKVRREAGLPPAEAGPIASPNANPLFRAHAEEDVANQFVHAVQAAGLTPADLKGRTLDIAISNPTGVCDVCRQGLANPSVPPGVLKQLSQMYPELTIRVTVQTQPGVTPKGGENILIRNGERVH
jgi:Domain of unknown function (DUF4781)